MATQNEKRIEDKLHKPEQDPELVETVELADSSSQRAVPCSCGFRHPKLTEGEINLNLGYDQGTKTFMGLTEYENTIIFTHHHPYYFGKL